MQTVETLGAIAGRETYHTVPAVTLDSGVDSRWAAWLERGRIRDRRVRQRLSVSGALLAMATAGAAIMYALARS
jgi:hypothetical protein